MTDEQKAQELAELDADVWEVLATVEREQRLAEAGQSLDRKALS